MKSTTRKTLGLVMAAALSTMSSGTTFAQTKTPTKADSQAKTAEPKGSQRTVRAMFGWADKNKDGQLSRAEAKGHLPITFSSFDTDKRGRISFDQFLAFTNKRVAKQAEDILKIGEPL